MSEQIIKKYEELINEGTKLVPLGGFEVSGYNARLQNKYLEWRKSCLENLEASGPIGFSYKQKILGDANGAYFFQPSALLILNCIKEVCEKIKAAPNLLVDLPSQQQQKLQQNTVQSENTAGVRTLKPPPKLATNQTTNIVESKKSTTSNSYSKVYVIGDSEDILRIQLQQFLAEIGIEEVEIERQHGKMLELDSLKDEAGVGYVFFIVNQDDMAYTMFEIGHFVGKLGKNRVCVLHMSDVNFPKNVPGVITKSIVIKLEEVSLGLLKDLKAAGYQINL